MRCRRRVFWPILYRECFCPFYTPMIEVSLSRVVCPLTAIDENPPLNTKWIATTSARCCSSADRNRERSIGGTLRIRATLSSVFSVVVQDPRNEIHTGMMAKHRFSSTCGKRLLWIMIKGARSDPWLHQAKVCMGQVCRAAHPSPVPDKYPI